MSSRRGILLVLFLIFLAIGISLVGSLLLIAGSAVPASIPAEATLYSGPAGTRADGHRIRKSIGGSQCRMKAP